MDFSEMWLSTREPSELEIIWWCYFAAKMQWTEFMVNGTTSHHNVAKTLVFLMKTWKVSPVHKKLMSLPTTINVWILPKEYFQYIKPMTVCLECKPSVSLRTTLE